MIMTRIFEDKNSDLVIYKRKRGHETNIPLYAEFRGETLEMEFRTSAQVVARLKKLHLI